MRTIFLHIFVLAFLAIGCSKGMDTVSPGSVGGIDDSIPVIGLTEMGGVFEQTGILGAYELTIDPDDMTAEIVAKRSMAIGESFIVSGKGFFTITPCTDCFKLKAIALDIDSNAVLTFSLRHPFELGNELKPPTARNRKDLDIFDVACVVVPLERTPTTYPNIGESVYSGICVDPDGYTKELENVFESPDSAAMPYFLVIDDSTDQSPPVRTYNKFGMGESSEFDMTFNISSSLILDLYLTIGYGAAARKSTFMSPKYFNPEFNRKAAWKVNVIPPVDPWAEDENSPLDTRIVTVEVYDWQTGATVSTVENYEDETDLTKVFSSSEVSEVSLEVFGVSNAVTVPTGSHTGMPDDPLIFEIPIANSAPSPASAGEYTGLVAVTDERPVATSFDKGRDYLIDSPDGMALNKVLLTEFATYQTFTAIVTTGCGPLQITNISGCPSGPIPNNSSITFSVTATNPDSTHLYYEIDSSYDPIDGFIPDSPAQADSGVFSDVIIGITPCIPDETVTVAFHVYDDCPTPNHVYDLDGCIMTIGSCVQPVGNVTLTVNRLSTGHGVDISNPWTLQWDLIPGAVQYAIYYDEDHTNGYVFNYVGSVNGSTNSYTVPASHVPANFYVKGNTYVVRARTIAGDPGSELPDSERAFVSMASFESIPNGVFGVTASNGEGWYTTLERTPFITYYGNAFYYWPSVAAHPVYKTNGANILSLMPWYLGENWNTSNNYPGDLCGITFEAPSVPNSSVRRIQVVGSCSNMWINTMDGGIVMGAVDSPSQPLDGWDGTDLIWAQADSGTGYQPYNYLHTDLIYPFPFDMTAYTSGNNCWRWDIGPPYVYQFTKGLMSADVGTVGDYLALAVYCEINIQPQPPVIYLDDLTVAIY